jgi:hypothetical protein
MLAAIRARAGRAEDARQSWEANLSRGLIDDLATRRSWPVTPAERGRQDEVISQLTRLDNQMAALGGAKLPAEVRVARMDQLKKQRLVSQERLAQLEADLIKEYHVAVGQVYRVGQIQAQLPADAALGSVSH